MNADDINARLHELADKIIDETISASEEIEFKELYAKADPQPTSKPVAEYD